MAIQSQTYSYGSLAYGSATKSYVLELTVTEESVSVSDNTSTVSYALRLISGSNNQFKLYHIGAQVWLGGALAGQRDRYANAQVTLNYNSSVVLLSGSAVIPHSADGTCTMPVSFSIDMEDGKYVPGSLSASGYTMELSVIPRQSTLGATNADIGAVSMIAVAKQAERFTHSIRYVFGELSGYVTAAGTTSVSETIFSATSIPFTLPEQFYTQIPSAPSGQCILTLQTYCDGVAVGTPSSCSFTATAGRSSCSPQISWNIKDVNAQTVALTGDARRLIRFASTARCELQVTAKNSAAAVLGTIGGERIALDPAGCGAREIVQIETAAIPYYGEDSRGYGREGMMTADMVPYIKLTEHTQTKRTDITAGTAKLLFSGAYFRGSFGAQENELHIRYRKAGEQAYTKVTDITVADGKYAAEAVLTDLDYQQAYSYEIQVCDALTEISKTVTVGKGQPVFHWGESDFQFHIPIDAPAVNGVFIKLAQVSGNTTITIGTSYDNFDANGHSRQSFFIFGSANGVPVQGTFAVNNKGEVFNATENLTITAGTEGRVTVNLPALSWDLFVIASTDHFTV